MPHVFYNVEGTIHAKFITRVAKINVNSHSDMPRRMRPTTRRKKPGRLSQGVIYQHKNTTPHSIRLIVVLLLTSPDFEPSDCH
jgi:hypothetical protein